MVGIVIVVVASKGQDQDRDQTRAFGDYRGENIPHGCSTLPCRRRSAKRDGVDRQWIDPPAREVMEGIVGIAKTYLAWILFATTPCVGDGGGQAGML